MGKSRKAEERVVLRKQDTLGAVDAEEDGAFLAECFVDTGDLALLRDSSRPERIVLGRTGSGKTALLIRLLETEQKCLEVKPENLALSYVSNSTILRFFEDLGVNLDPFYKLIWRHAFCVELLKERYGKAGPKTDFGILEWIKAIFKGRQHTAAIKYLEKWGNRFWEETDVRVKEITRKVENSLEQSLGGKLGPASLSTANANSLSEEVRAEVTERAQKVVNDAHVPQLNQILDLVRDVLDDAQKKYFIVIDRLDESWVDDQLRYKLIMALIDTVKEFRRVPNAKIVVALRLDLLQRVYKRARTAGFQEEKMESLYLRLRWTRKDLVEIINARVNHLFRDRYSKNKVLKARDILVQSRRDADPMEYLLDRTFLRPRDAISFFNECMAIAQGRAKITMKHIRLAEDRYSKGRLQSVADEWHVEFPNLLLFAKAFLSGTKSNREALRLLDEETILERCLSLQSRELSSDDFTQVCHAVLDGSRPPQDMLRAACSIFFRVGIIAAKLSATDGYTGYSDTGKRLDATEFRSDTLVQVHPMFCRALGVAPAGG